LLPALSDVPHVKKGVSCFFFSTIDRKACPFVSRPVPAPAAADEKAETGPGEEEATSPMTGNAADPVPARAVTMQQASTAPARLYV